jgi:intracellular septation protein
MQLLLEYLPLAAFLVAYNRGGIYVATATLMIAMTLSVLVHWVRTRRIPQLLGISTLLVLLFGTATLILRNARFIQWKPSIFLWLLAVAFLVSAGVGKQPLAQRMLQPSLGELQVERPVWLRLNLAWVLFGLIAGAANICIAYHVSEAMWVKVKVFGLSAAMFLFLVAQLLWLHSRARPRT